MELLTVAECLRLYLQARAGLIVDEERALIAVERLEARIVVEAVGAGLFDATARYARQRGMEVASSTVRRELGVLKAALQWAWKSGRIAFVPALHAAKSMPPKLRVLNDAELKALVSAAEKQPVWLYNFVLLLLLTGQRKSAVLNLRYFQIDLKNRVINFPDPYMPLAERRKGRGTVPMNDELYALLKPAMENIGFEHLHDYVIHNKGQRVFHVYRDWERMTKAAGLNGVTPHVLRHTVATNLVRDNANIYQVSKLLGHASVQTTERCYVTHNPENLRGMMNHVSARGKA
jgi:integrase